MKRAALSRSILLLGHSGRRGAACRRGLEIYAALLRKTEREDTAEEMEARAHAIRVKHAQENPVE